MKRMTKILWMLIVLGFISSCTKDEIETNYTSPGTFILSEGNFSDGVGTLDFMNLDSSKIFKNAYQSENSGSPLGSVAQSMNIIGDNAYFVINNSAKVVVTDSKTLVKQADITDLAQPRYIIKGKNDNLYISQWGIDGTSGAIKVINSKTNIVSSTIEVGGGPEHMLMYDNNLYVAKSGGYGRDNKVVMINPNTNEVSNEIKVGDNPVDIVLDRNQEIWVLCKGYSDWSDPSNSTSGQLVKIIDNEVVQTIEVPNGAFDLCLNKAKDKLYFLSGSWGAVQVYEQDITDTSFANKVLIAGNYYALDFNPYTDELFLSEANMTSNGLISIYNPAGEKTTESFEGGVYTGSFFFVN